MIKRSYLCGSTALAVAISFGLTAPAAAQVGADKAAPSEVEEVVVTGSYIAGTPEDAALPVDVIGAKDLEQQGSPTVVQLVKTITAAQSGIGESNRYNGGAGTASINLRGFGASRTLSLFNGRRMADSPAAAFQGGGADLNFIPTAAIGRIEILKDGAAATYGSDAIGGVVNFITRTDLNGLELEGEYSAIQDSNGDYHANLAWGKKFDAGNVLLTAGYRHRSRLDIRDRDFALRGFDFGGYAGGGGWSGNSNPGNYQNASSAAFLFRDNGCTELGGALTNTVTFNTAGIPNATATSAVAVPVSAQNPQAATSQCRFQFSNYNDLVNHEDHYQVYGEINFEFAENQKFHGEVAWNRNNVPNQRISPANGNTQFPTPTSLGGESGSLRPPTVINFFVPFNVPSNNPGLVDLYTTCAAPLTAAQCTSISTAANTARPASNPLGGSRLGTNGIDMSQTAFRFIANAGHPTNPDKADHQDIEQTEFRISGSVRGDLPWFGITYDTALTYMRAEQVVNISDLLVERAQLALNGFGSLSNDPTSCNAAERQVAANAGNNAVGCYFFNPFSNSVQVSATNGATNPYFRPNVANNPQLVEWLYGNYTNVSLNELFVFDAVFSGKSGLNLPGGEVAWAAGYQYRYTRDKNDYGDLFNNQITPCVDSVVDGTPICNAPNGPLIFFGSNSNTDSDRAVWAVFGEVHVPILDNLEVNAAVRHEDYPGGIGSTTNPKVAVKWQVTDWLALRGSAGTTFRAPTIAAASSGCQIGVANLGGQYRAVRTCGNPALGPEKADTYNAGVVFETGGFRATLDYYKFKFKGELTSEPASGLLTALATPGACGNAALIARFQFDSTIGCTANGAGVLRIDVNNVNGPATKTSGLDFRAEYNVDDFLLDGASWQAGVEATYLIDYKRGDFVLAGTSTVFQAALDRAGKHDLLGAFFSYPETRANGWLALRKGPFTARWQVRYTEGTEPAVASAGLFRTEANPNATTTAAACAASTTPSCAGRDLVTLGKSNDYWQHDLIVRWEAPWDTVITASVQNIFDKDPPYLTSNFNYDYTNGNPLGRVFEIGFKKEF
jgi:iron complex outermembrane receptor protein